MKSELETLSHWLQWQHDRYALSINHITGDEKYYPFYGLDGCAFKLGPLWYEAKEDEQDGYRSCLDRIDVMPPAAGKNLIDFDTPVAYLTVKYVDEYNNKKGWEAVDRNGHVWLFVGVGTDYSADYYPGFQFVYTPDMTPVQAEP